MNTLKLQSPMMHGPAVVRLQELLDGLSPWYDTGPNDGIFGTNTAKAVKLFQNDHGLKPDSICGPITWKAILSAHDHDEDRSKGDYGIADITAITRLYPPKNYANQRILESIVGITLHQTGCEMPSNPTGWKRLNAHYGITLEGIPIRVNPLTRMIWHAQGLSQGYVGVEIEGNHEGIAGDHKTLWRGGGGPHYLNERMIAGAQFILRDIMEQCPMLKYITAHRQSSETRRADPGSEIWKRIAMPWIDAGILDDRAPRYRLPRGRVLPLAWGDRYEGKY